MASHRRRTRDLGKQFDEINVTPLLDLTFLLLIVFMLSMPLMEYGTQINAPQMNSGSLPEQEFKSITLTGKGTIMLGRETVTGKQLCDELISLKSTAPKTQILLRADGSCSYKQVIELMAEIRHCGFDDVTLITKAEDGK